MCRGCFSYDDQKKTIRCKNRELFDNKFRLLRIGVSAIPNAGLGLFAGENIPSNTFVSSYVGEIIESSLEAIRETVRKTETFYNFGNEGGSIDARKIGNKARFINHGG